MQITAHDSISDLQRLAKRTQHGRTRLRIQGIILGLQGQSSQAIGAALGVSSRSVRDWVRRYNTGGSAALVEQPRQGRPAFLKEEDIPRFRARIEAGAQPADGVCSLRGADIQRIGADIQRILEEEFSTSYRLNGVYDLLHRLGYSSLMPRPRHAQADKERQDEFKKSVR